MNIKKIILIITSVVLLFTLSYNFKFGETANNENVFVVGTSLDYPPYEFIDAKTGQAAGFDIDLVHEIAERLGKNLIIKNMSFSSLIFGLLTGDIDVIASGISPTERRAKLVAFSDKYLTGVPFVVLSKVDTLQPKSMQDLYAKSVAVNTGYITDMYMANQHPNVELIRLDSPAESFLALQTGVVDAFVTSPHTAQTFLQNVSNPEDFFVMQIPDTGEICALAVAKNNEQLLKQINEALHAMSIDGTLEQIKVKWGF